NNNNFLMSERRYLGDSEINFLQTESFVENKEMFFEYHKKFKYSKLMYSVGYKI
ncbi:hypothetical protein LCGC14_2294830, partial [marine sediment metagenome]